MLDLLEEDLLSPAARRWADDHGLLARDVGAYVLALGNAPSYTETFLEALAVETARFPLASARDVVEEAVRAGKTVLDAWCLRVAGVGTWHQEQAGVALGEATIDGGTVRFENGDRLGGLDPGVGTFTVSRYPVLPRFLQARAHLTLTAALAEDIRTVAAAIGTILDLQRTCDDLLARAIGSS